MPHLPSSPSTSTGRSTRPVTGPMALTASVRNGVAGSTITPFECTEPAPLLERGGHVGSYLQFRPLVTPQQRADKQVDRQRLSELPPKFRGGAPKTERVALQRHEDHVSEVLE